MAIRPGVRYRINLATRLNVDIDNEINWEPVTLRDIRLFEDARRRHPNAVPRNTKVTYTYNCHGLTFASRRTQVSVSNEVAQVLAMDDYLPVRLTDVAVGDIVIYRAQETGEIEHSGIVVDPGRGGNLIQIPLILSKWGSGKEMIHKSNDCPYVPATIEYYRIES